MSYCRFSSDDFGCDVYVYEDIYGGYTIHVAESMYLGDIPKVPDLDPNRDLDDQIPDVVNARIAQSKFLDTAERKKIGLDYDGETFSVETPGECAEKLIELQLMGYRVPQYAIDALIDEEEERSKE